MSILIINLLWIFLAHYILDYPLQGNFLAQTKGKYIYSLFAHSIIYGLGMAALFYILSKFAIWKAIILVISYMIIDYKKSNAKDRALTTYLYI